jgi:peptide/nickel transport system substrate-binding protein
VRRGRSGWPIAFVLVVALVAAACGGGGGKKEEQVGGATTETTAAAEVPRGGTLVLGAEQEPDCADWISSCAGASWGYWTMNVQTMPRAFDVVKKGGVWTYVPSILLTGEPELKTSPKQVVTYHINPKAVWSDGQPITSTDFKYTWEQIVKGEDIYDRTGYTNIESVDDSDPKTAVVTFSTPYAAWKGLFGGGYGIYPSHLLAGKDRNAAMKDGYSFSGGPWKIEKWEKQVQVVLVPNENYWGEKPRLDRVVFKFITDTSAEFQAFKAGEVLAIYPQPQLDAVDQITAGLPGANSVYTADTGNLEALWMNNAKAPFDDVKFRQAVAYAIDRDAIVKRLFGAIGVEKASQSLNPPILSRFTDVNAWAGYKRDLKKVEELMTAAGWKKGPDGIWAKGGQRATFEIKSTAGNKRRELTEQVLQQQLKEAGFEMTVNNQKAGDLFGDQLPKGDYQLSLYAQVLTSLDPGLCNLFCSKNIPTQANNFSGQNWQRVNIAALDPLLEKVDVSLDDDERAAAQKQADRIMAENMVSLPLDPLPNILLWSKKIVGPVGDNPILGPFHNLNLWGLRA